MIPHFFWLCNVTGFRVGKSLTFSDGTTSAYTFSSMNRAVMDTGTSLFYVPSGMWTTFVKTVMKGISYDVYSNLVVATCDTSKYKSIYVVIDGYYLEITPENYVLTVDIGMPGYCLLGFTKNSGNYWLMGDSFLRNFYTIWDEE